MKLESVKIKNIPIHFSDHQGILAKIIIPEGMERGRGFWKLNGDLLRSSLVKDDFRNFWEGYKMEYNLPNHKIGEWWDKAKRAIKSFFIANGIEVEKENNNKRLRLENVLQTLYDNRTKGNNNIDEIKKTESELKKLDSEELIGAVLRSRSFYIDEKPTRLFFKLESENNSQIRYLKNKNWAILKNHVKIREEIRDFYKNLYREEPIDTKIENEFLKTIKNKLNENEQKELEGEITLERSKKN